MLLIISDESSPIKYFEGNIPSESAGARLFKQERLYSTIR